MSHRFWTSLWLLGPTRASTLPGVSLSTATFRIARRRSLWTSFLTSSTPVAFMCERETPGFLRTQSFWRSIVLSLRQVCELVTLRFQWDRTFRFLCAALNATSLAMARTSADDPTLYAVDAARSMLISTSAQLLPTASIAKAIIPPLASSVRSSWKNKPF